MGDYWKWQPTPEQSRTFEDWKDYLIGYLVTCKDGVNVTRMLAELREYTEEDVPLQKMGITSVYTFLYELRNCIDLREQCVVLKSGTKRQEIHVFIRESAIPQHMMHIRQNVLHQRKAKSNKPKAIKRLARSVDPRRLLEEERKRANWNFRTNSNPQLPISNQSNRKYVGKPPANRSNFNRPRPATQSSSNYSSRPVLSSYNGKASAPAPSSSRIDDLDWSIGSAPAKPPLFQVNVNGSIGQQAVSTSGSSGQPTKTRYRVLDSDSDTDVDGLDHSTDSDEEDWGPSARLIRTTNSARPSTPLSSVGSYPRATASTSGQPAISSNSAVTGLPPLIDPVKFVTSSLGPTQPPPATAPPRSVASSLGVTQPQSAITSSLTSRPKVTTLTSSSASTSTLAPVDEPDGCVISSRASPECLPESEWDLKALMDLNVKRNNCLDTFPQRICSKDIGPDLIQMFDALPDLEVVCPDRVLLSLEAFISYYQKSAKGK